MIPKTKLISLVLSGHFVLGCASQAPKAVIEPTQPPVNISATANETSALWNTALSEPMNEAYHELQEKEAHASPLARELNLAQIALAKNEVETAKTHARQALTYDIKNDKARMVMVHVYLRKNLIDLAEIALGGLSKDYQNRAEVYNVRALIALKRKDSPMALAQFKKGLSVDATNAAIRMNLGILYLSYRQVRSAARQFERILKDHPRHIDAKFHLAVARAAMGEATYSRDVYEDVIDAIEDHPFAMFNIALLDADDENYQEAIKGLKRYLSTDIAKSSNNSEIFALISEFENMKASMARAPSDEEIQKMAAKAAPEHSPRKSDASDAFGYSDAPAATDTEEDSDAQVPKTRKRESSPSKSKTSPDIPADADLEMLQKELRR